MPFLPPSQQRQSTEGKYATPTNNQQENKIIISSATA